MSRPFVPLHVHTHYSILDSATKVDDLIAVALKHQFPAIAVTDHGVMHGAIELYQKAKAAGIKPIIGCELYMVDGDPTDRVTKRPYHHLVLLAKNMTGYKNLVKLVTKGHLEGFYYKPRVSWEQLAAHAEGLIALTSDLSGPIGHAVMRNTPQEAEERAKWLKNVFGEDVYLELQDHGLEGERRLNAELLRLSKLLDMKLVITNDSHFTHREDEQAHDILLCMQTGKTLHDPARMRQYGSHYYLKSGDELFDHFQLDKTIVNAALDQTLLIADQCNLELDLDGALLPDYPVPAGMTPETYLQHLVFQAAPERFLSYGPEVEERLNMELSVINQMGFPAYFLIVWDFINYARNQNIPVGPGRGSAAGSAVAFSLGITNIDPIEHNLLFERFLNPERVSMPDIDIDFCIARRDDVIEYVNQRYGKERVAQITTFGTLAARAALKAVCRVMDIPFAESDKLAKLIPATPGTKLKDAIGPDMELGKIYASDPNVKTWIDLALQIEGTNANSGVHAAGVVISKDPLEEVVPLMLSKEGQVVTQYAMDDVAKLGLLKMDFLGLRNLTIMDKAVNLIAQHGEKRLDLDRLTLDDPDVYAMLTSGQTDGVFQLESGGMKALVKELKPSQFEDINALVALFRPGPLNSGMVEEFVKRKHGKSKVDYAHPDLEPILKDTYGTIVYQEQIMQIAQVLAGYTLGQADILRRAMGKKKESEMNKQRELFLSGSSVRGIDEKVANTLFDAMTEFAKYCFNRSHSAAYALIAYQTAYLKCHYPVEYLSALLSSVSSDLDKIQLYILTARKMGIAVLPPDINKSDADFTPDGQAIRFGLASIKNVGEGVVERIIAIRKEKPYTSIADFCERAELKTINRRALESLIWVGAFDSFGVSRKQLAANVENLYAYAAKLQERKETGQVSLFAALSGGASADLEGPAVEGFREELHLISEADEYGAEDIQRYEKTLLGSYVSSHPLDDVLDIIPLVSTANAKDLPEASDGATVVMAGLVASMVQKTTKTNKPLRIGQLQDVTGSVEFVAFSEAIANFDDLLAEGQKVVINGKVQFRGDDQVSLVVNSVKPLSDVKILKLAIRQAPRYEDVAYLREVLKKAKGTDPVVLVWADQTRLIVGPQFWVDYDQVMPYLQTAIGNGLGYFVSLADTENRVLAGV